MARIVDPNQPVDPVLQQAIAGRSRHSLREGPRARGGRKRREKFFVPPELIPSGYVVEWKRKSCLGRPEEADYFMELNDGGWKPAPVEKFRVLMPEDYEGKTVERGGMVLMMRPKHLKEESIKLDHEEAVGQVRDKLSEIGMTGQGELPRKAFAFDRHFERPTGRSIPDDNGDDGFEE